MDISEEYITMCAKAKEIQKCVPRNFDGTIGGSKEFFKYYEPIDKVVWLPRQDQLQNILGNYKTCIESLEDIFCNDDYNIIPIYSLSISTLEQVWLMLVMHKKFNKIWTGKEWIVHK